MPRRALSPDMTDEQVAEFFMDFPNVLLEFPNKPRGFEVMKRLKFLIRTDSGRLRPPDGIVVRLWGAPDERPVLLIAGDIRPSDMLEAVEQCIANGAHIVGLGFVGADCSEAWASTVERLLELNRRGPDGSEMHVLVPAYLQPRAKAHEGSGNKPSGTNVEGRSDTDKGDVKTNKDGASPRPLGSPSSDENSTSCDIGKRVGSADGFFSRCLQAVNSHKGLAVLIPLICVLALLMLFGLLWFR
jgi:hypothetical protein